MATNVTLPASGGAAPRRNPRHSRPLPRWTKHLHLASTAMLILTVIALAVALFDARGPGRGGDDGEPDNLAAVPIATVPPGQESSSIPYPTADECTVEPLAEQEITDMALEGARGPGYAVSKADSTTAPTETQAAEIMGTFREFQACQMKGPRYALAMMTPFGIAQDLMILYLPGEGTPVTEASVAERVDTWIVDPTELPRTPAPTIASAQSIPSTPIPEGVNEMGTPIVAVATMAPKPDEGLPDAVLTLFPEDIQMIDDSNAIAVAYWVDPDTGEVQYRDPRVLRLTMMDGQWLIDGQRDGLGQG